ncbi:hypothetical protein ABE545_10745 [Sphingobacterium faecium]|uniref:hypothetical protein n=1 Tax=Sphingobacterium faecium TaxID=34087 RepID=UPI003209117A
MNFIKRLFLKKTKIKVYDNDGIKLHVDESDTNKPKLIQVDYNMFGFKGSVLTNDESREIFWKNYEFDKLNSWNTPGLSDLNIYEREITSYTIGKKFVSNKCKFAIAYMKDQQDEKGGYAVYKKGKGILYRGLQNLLIEQALINESGLTVINQYQRGVLGSTIHVYDKDGDVIKEITEKHYVEIIELDDNNCIKYLLFDKVRTEKIIKI